MSLSTIFFLFVLTSRVNAAQIEVAREGADSTVLDGGIIRNTNTITFN